MKDSVKEVAEYFGKRAARYQLSQETCPMARSLDLIPYVYVIDGVIRQFSRSPGDLRIFDAFGGSGFLSRSFAHTEIRFTIADCTNAYKQDGSNKHEWLICPDYFRAISAERAGEYDLVFAHGGLHHVYVKDNAGLEDETSVGLQHQCVANLSRLLRKGGFLVLADIPDRPSRVDAHGSDISLIDTSMAIDLFGNERLAFLRSAATDFSLSPSLNNTCHTVESIFRDSTHPGSLRRFFDEEVARKTPNGHEACFLDFERIIARAAKHDLCLMALIPYPGAWVFETANQAVWFFREMFGFGQSMPPFQEDSQDYVVKSAISDTLGMRSVGDHLAVNWGVSYAIFRRD